MPFIHRFCIHLAQHLRDTLRKRMATFADKESDYSVRERIIKQEKE